jgi:hypothetical protein
MMLPCDGSSKGLTLVCLIFDRFSGGCGLVNVRFALKAPKPSQGQEHYVWPDACDSHGQDLRRTPGMSYFVSRREKRKLQWLAPPASVWVRSKRMPRVA